MALLKVFYHYFVNFRTPKTNRKETKPIQNVPKPSAVPSLKMSLLESQTPTPHR